MGTGAAGAVTGGAPDPTGEMTVSRMSNVNMAISCSKWTWLVGGSPFWGGCFVTSRERGVVAGVSGSIMGGRLALFTNITSRYSLLDLGTSMSFLDGGVPGGRADGRDVGWAMWVVF